MGIIIPAKVVERIQFLCEMSYREDGEQVSFTQRKQRWRGRVLMLRLDFQGLLLVAFELHVPDLDFFPAQAFSNLTYLHRCLVVV